MKRFLTPALVALLAAFSAPLFAQGTQTPRLDKRENKQEQRINQGEASGALTNKEAARLEAGEARLDAKEAAAKADGKVTKKERVKLNNARDRQSTKIYKQKHDAQHQ